jgi:hypothetical protein
MGGWEVPPTIHERRPGVKWFGTNWGAPICRDLEQVPVPVETKCFHCDCHFDEHDRGLVLPYSSAEGTVDTFWHLVCFRITVLG